MLKFGKFEITAHTHGSFRLDGGAMFGSVPKNIWSKCVEADKENCIALTTRSLMLRCNDKVFLIDVGLGDKWSEKEKNIFNIKNIAQDKKGFRVEDVTDLILTHLHFDHAGGISCYSDDSQKEVELCYPNAHVWLQEDNYGNAKNPTLKERASYLKHNVEILESAKLELVKGSVEIFPDLWLHQVNGHTLGQQWVEIKSSAESIVFPSDLIPTAHHLPLAFHMGYDICAQTILQEKADFLKRAVENNWLIVFEHDPVTTACRVELDARGRYSAAEKLSI